MKRFFLFLLSLSLMLPAAALALDREVDPYYGYAHIEVSKDGVPFMTVIYFSEDQTCYYLTQLFQSDGVGLGRAYVGMWGYTADGEVFAKTGDNTTRTFHITSLDDLVDVETMEVFERFSALMK